MDKLDPKTEWIRIDEVGGMGLNFLEEGRLNAVTVNGTVLCLARNGGKLYAIRNRCPHAGGPLHQGKMDAEGNIECPWHKFRFCVKDGKNADGGGSSSETFPLEINQEGTFVGFPRRKKWLGIF